MRRKDILACRVVHAMASQEHHRHVTRRGLAQDTVQTIQHAIARSEGILHDADLDLPLESPSSAASEGHVAGVLRGKCKVHGRFGVAVEPHRHIEGGALRAGSGSLRHGKASVAGCASATSYAAYDLIAVKATDN